MKAAVYVRCSTKKQDLDSQIKELVEWAKKNNHESVKVFQDFAVSGKKDNRKGINSLLESARKKEFDVVGVLELSRIGRSIGFIHNTIEELSSLGIQIVLTKRNTTLDYNALEGRALIGGLALASDIEWMLIKERNERGRRAIKERGVKVGRKHIDVSSEAINALREKDYSLRMIAKELGVSAPTIMRRINTTRL